MSTRVRRHLEKALIYIDENLDKQLSAEQVASQAFMSEFHFQRVFSSYLGETLSQYFLHRRLELAAKKLIVQKNMKIIDIAFGSGFESKSYFSRAFKKHFNLSPREFRKSVENISLGSDANRPFLKTVASKNKTIDVQVVKHSTLWCNNKKIISQNHDEMCNEENLQTIQQGFNEILSSKMSKLFGVITSSSYADNTAPMKSDCGFAEILYGALYVEKHDDAWSPDWLEVEAGLWAVCTHVGDYKYKYQTLNYAVRSWLPDSGYELRNTMGFELYRKHLYSQDPGVRDLQLYIPIKKSLRQSFYML